MKKLFKYLFLLLFPLSLAAQSPVSRTELNYDLKKDGREWKVGYETENKDMNIKEFLPNNDTVDNWTEMLTIHHYFGITISLDKYFEAFMRELQKMVPESKVEYRLLNKTNNSLMGEWWIKDNTSNSQHELFRVLTQGGDVYIMRYTTRKPNPENQLKIWKQILGEATVVNRKLELPADKEAQLKQIQEMQFSK